MVHGETALTCLLFCTNIVSYKTIFHTSTQIDSGGSNNINLWKTELVRVMRYIALVKKDLWYIWRLTCKSAVFVLNFSWIGWQSTSRCLSFMIHWMGYNLHDTSITNVESLPFLKDMKFRRKASEQKKKNFFVHVSIAWYSAFVLNLETLSHFLHFQEIEVAKKHTVRSHLSTCIWTPYSINISIGNKGGRRTCVEKNNTW